jgi:hypothetical protein
VAVYYENEAGPTRPRQAREDRPNPRWPQDEEIEGFVARVRAIIAANPAAFVNIPSPVADIVADIVGDEWTAARVVEGVLADSACRFMLSGVGLHACGSPRRRRTSA